MTYDVSLIDKIEAGKLTASPEYGMAPECAGYNDGLDHAISIIRQHTAPYTRESITPEEVAEITGRHTVAQGDDWNPKQTQPGDRRSE